MSSGAVDTKTVEMRFDNSDFEKNAKQSMSTLERLKHALKLDGASAGLREVERESRKLDFRSVRDDVGEVGKRFSVLEQIAIGVLRRIGESAADAGMKLVKSFTVDQVAAGWSKYEEKTTAVQTIMSNLKDTEGNFIDDAAKLEYVNKYLSKLLWFSDETSYGFTDMTSNVGKFIANGQGLEDSVTAMQGIATWAAVSGQNAQTASRAMYNISQAMGTGSMQIKDWMSIENANMATAQFKELAITVGQKKKKIKEGQVTIESFRESLAGKDTKGWFDKEVMMEVFQTYGEAANRIQEYSEAHDVTSTEAIREIKKTDKEFADSLGFKAFAAAQEAKTFSDVVSATGDAVSTKWMRIFENIFGDYLEAKELWTSLSEDMWDIFAGPLDTMNDIMSVWNKGFLENGPENWIQQHFLNGDLDQLDNPYKIISKSTAEMAVEADSAHFKIKKLEDGTKSLVQTVEDGSGTYKEVVTRIYDYDKDLLSGRQMLIDGFKNILDSVFHDVENEDGTVQLSILGAIKQAFQEIVFGSSDLKEIMPSIAEKLWNVTKRFRDFTERMRPSKETLDQVKTAFKGIFDSFKFGGKLVSSIAKPFKDLFSRVFKNPAKGLLDLSSSIGTWVQKLHTFFEENKIFDKITGKVSTGLSKLQNGLDKITVSLTGLTASELSKVIRDKIFGFFDDFDFQAKYDQVSSFFNGLETQILQVKNGDLPEKLTPFQKFLVRAKSIFDGIKNFVSTTKETIFGPGPLLTNIVKQIKEVKSGELPETLTPFQKFLITGEKVFQGIKTLLSFISSVLSGTISSVKDLIQTGDFGAFFKNLGQVFSGAKDNIEKSGAIGSLIDTFKSLDFKGLIRIITDALSSAKEGIVDSGVLGKFFQGLGKVFTAATDFLASIFNNKGLLGFLKTAAKIGIVAYLAKFVYSLFKGNSILSKVGGLIDSIGGAFDSISDFFKSKKTEALAKAALAFGAAIFLLSLSVSMLGKMEPENLYRGIIAVALLALIFVGFKKLNKDTEAAKQAAVSFAIFAVAITLLTNCVKKLGDLDSKQIFGGIVAIAALVLIFALFKKLTKGAEGIGKAALSFIFFGVAVDILAIGVKALGQLDLWQIIKGVAAIAALVVVFSWLIKLNEMRIDFGKITSSFILFGVAVDILAIGVKALGKMKPAQLLAGVLTIAALVLVFYMLGRLNSSIIDLGDIVSAFLVFGIAIDVMSIGVKALGKLSLGEIVKGTIAIAAMALVFSLLTKLNEMRLNMGKSVGAFLLFGIAIDIMSIGIKALGELDTEGLYNGIAAIGAVIALFAVFNSISSDAGTGSIGSLLAFSVVIIALALGLKAMIPVMQQIQAMGDDWWKPLVFMAAAIGLIVAAGAISGIGIVTAGLMALSVVAVAIGAACLLAGLGIKAAADGIANLAETIAKYGPQATANISSFIEGFLTTIIANGPRLAMAGTVLIISLASAIVSASGALVAAAVYLIVQFVLSVISTVIALVPSIVEGIVAAINAVSEAIRVSAPVLTKAIMGLLESVMEAVLVSIATIVEPWGGVGSAISNKIMKWIPGIRDAFGVASDTAEAAGEEAADSYVEGFNGGGAGRSIDAPEIEVNQSATSTGVDMESIMSQIPGLSGEKTDITPMLSIDTSGLTSMFGESIGGINIGGMMDGKMGELTSSIERSNKDVGEASQGTADAIEKPIKNLDSKKWGEDIGNNLSSGLRSVIPTVETTASDMAAAIAKYVHFSEPDEGPLSNFHTFAPDMIKLWCKGVRDNIGQVESSGETMADAVYDGFSTALDYVSDLIDNGMSDQLTIRPVMDLSEIQNGVDSMYGMMSNANGYEITGTTRLAASTAYGMRGTTEVVPADTQTVQADVGPTNNTFYITNGDPDAVAQRVSKILSQQTRRQKAVFAK